MIKKKSIRLRGKAYEKLERACFERDGYKCRISGYEGYIDGDGKVHGIVMHHIKLMSQIVLDILINVMTVTPKIHTDIHMSLNGLSTKGVMQDYGAEVTKYLKEG